MQEGIILLVLNNLFLQQPLLNMEKTHQLTSTYLALLEQIRNLLSRQNLCNNNYLYKHMKNHLTLPLYAFAQERKIAHITTNEQDIIQALRESGLAKVLNERQVTIIDYPTIKISLKNQEIFKEIETVLKQHEKKYRFTERVQKQYINLTIFEEDDAFLLQIIPSLTKEVEFQKVTLLEDMKEGVNRIKKIKLQQKNNSNYKNGSSGFKYSFDKPPQVFIRRAVDSSDEEEQDRQKMKGVQKKKKYKQVVKQVKQKQLVSRPVFNSEDFPSLS